jgi:hypothetical protein
MILFFIMMQEGCIRVSVINTSLNFILTEKRIKWLMVIALSSVCVYIVTCRLIAGRWLCKHIPVETFWVNTPLIGKANNKYAGSTRITSVSMQLAVNTTIKEAVFYIWFVCIHCWVKDMFSIVPPQDYISSPVVNQKSVVDWEWNKNGVSPQLSSKKGFVEDWFWVIVIMIMRDCKRMCY